MKIPSLRSWYLILSGYFFGVGVFFAVTRKWEASALAFCGSLAWSCCHFLTGRINALVKLNASILSTYKNGGATYTEVASTSIMTVPFESVTMHASPSSLFVPGNYVVCRKDFP